MNKDKDLRSSSARSVGAAKVLGEGGAEHPGVANLRQHQRQLDADGIEVGVSRQALDETLALYDELLAVLKTLDGKWSGDDWATDQDAMHSLVREAIAKAVQS